MKNKYTIQELNNKTRVDKINIYNIKKCIEVKDEYGGDRSVHFILWGLFFHYFNTKKIINPIIYDVNHNIILKIFLDYDTTQTSTYRDCDRWEISRSVGYSYYMSHFDYIGFEFYISKNYILKL